MASEFSFGVDCLSRCGGTDILSVREQTECLFHRLYTRRFFGGRQPLCGSGVTSSMTLMVRPAACSAVMADSRPAPGPLTLTSTSLRPNFIAFSAACSAARWAAKGVLLRLPLKPTVPADANVRVSPAVSLMVTMVLLNVAWMWAMPRLTLRRCLRFFCFAIALVV